MSPDERNIAISPEQQTKEAATLTARQETQSNILRIIGAYQVSGKDIAGLVSTIRNIAKPPTGPIIKVKVQSGGLYIFHYKQPEIKNVPKISPAYARVQQLSDKTILIMIGDKRLEKILSNHLAENKLVLSSKPASYAGVSREDFVDKRYLSETCFHDENWARAYLKARK